MCFLHNVFVCLGSLGILAASWASGVCVCVPLTVTSCVDLSYSAHEPKFVFFIVYICSHDMNTACSMS